MHSKSLSRWISGGLATAVLWSGIGGTPVNARTRPAAAPATSATQSDQAQQPLAVTAGGVRITYLYASSDASGASTANTFKTFLDANGYTVTPVAIANDGSATANPAGTDLFIIAADTGSGGTWAGSDGLSNTILASEKPVVGLGAGGQAFFARGTSALGDPAQTRAGQTVQISDYPTSRFAYQGPHALAVAPDSDVQLYTSPVNVVAIPLNTSIPDGDRYAQLQETQRLYLPLVQNSTAATASGSTAPQQGPIVSASGLFPLLRDGKFMLWGFDGDTSAMTEAGRNLFLNLLSIQSQSLQLNLQARAFTPGAGIDADVAPALAASAAGLHLYMQLDHLPSPTERTTLQSKGINLLENLIGQTYLAFVNKAFNAGDPALTGLVRWIGLIPNTDKLQPVVAAGAFDAWADNGDNTVNVNVLFHTDVPSPTVQSVMAGVTAVFTLTSDLLVQARLPKTSIIPLSQNDTVKWIEQIPPPPLPEEANGPTNDVTRNELDVDEVQNMSVVASAPYYGGLNGNGLTVAVMDNGVFAPGNTDHPDLLAARMVRNNFDSSAVSATGHGHGTHVAGIIAADGTDSQTNCPVGVCTAFQMRGMAPAARIASFPQSSGNAGDYKEAYVDLHAIVSTHSYRQTCMTYDGTAQIIDRIIRGSASSGGTAIPARPYTKSAGNAGSGAQWCTGQQGYYSLSGISKNPIIVGSLDPGTNFTLSDFSSKGPTWDQRIKPDIVSIGCQNSLDIDSDGYVSKCGTSMATPTVAGIITLMTEQFQNTFATSGVMLPSTYKAILVNTAQDLTGTGSYNDPDFCPAASGPSCRPVYFAGPDYTTGYGVVNAQRAVNAVAAQNFVEDEVSPSTTTRNYTFTISAQRRITFTLAWDDEEGSTSTAETAAKLVNDLDLTVIDPNGVTYFPWTLPALPAPTLTSGRDVLTQTNIVAASRGVDRVNNVEQVGLSATGTLTPGVWTVRVNAFNLPNGNAQKFSLAGDFRFLRIVDPVEGAAASAGDPTNPDKLLVKLWAGSTLNGANVSLAGAQATDFTVNISKAGYNANASVLSGLPVGDQFWLVVQPQAPGAAGYYSMTVTWNGFGSASERRNVLFLEKIPVDRAVVIDQSGSMSDYGKMEAARNGARLYVDQTNTDDALAVVAFENSATTPYPIHVNTSGSSVLADAKTSINGLVPLGGTAIGQGLNRGQDQLEALGRTQPEWRMVLLSDGMENVPPYWADPAVKGRIQPSRTIIDTVAVGPSAAGLHALLAQIAADTGGRSYHVAESGPAPLASAMSAADTSDTASPSAAEGTTAFDTFPQRLENKLADIYKTISEDSLRHQRVFEFRDTLTCQKDDYTWDLTVEKDVPQVIFAVNWSNPGADLRLLVTTPSGVLLTATPPDIVNDHDATHDSWRIFKPEPGVWKIRMRPAKCIAGTEFMLFQSIRTQLTLLAQTGGDIRNYCVGQPIPIIGILADTKGMINDDQADVTVDVLGPTREENVLGLPLIDDGGHDDGAKLNGIYANWFTGATRAGVYTARVYAVGKSNFGEPFTRHRLITFVVRPCVAYVLRNDTAAALSYENLLESHGMRVDLIPTVAATGTNFSKYQLVVIGADTGTGSGGSATWFGGPSAVSQIAQFAVPVIGNGVGGGAFFQALGLQITWAQSWVNTNAETVGVMNGLDSAWNKTYSVTVPASNLVQLYQKPATSLEVYDPGAAVEIKQIAFNPAAKDHFPIAQQATLLPSGGQVLRPYLLWGFYDSPARMTTEGKQTYVNLAWTMRK